MFLFIYSCGCFYSALEMKLVMVMKPDTVVVKMLA